MTEQWPYWVIVEKQLDDTGVPIKETLDEYVGEAWLKYEALPRVHSLDDVDAHQCRIEVKP